MALNLKNICIAVDQSIFSVHHGVRRYLMTIYGALSHQGHRVWVVDVSNPEVWSEVIISECLRKDNGFSGNYLVGGSRKQILKVVRSGHAEKTKFRNPAQHQSRGVAQRQLPNFDLCILGAPWVGAPQFQLPMASRYVCVAYDTIPNLYYFSDPENKGLHDFAHAHHQGYLWADNKQKGIFCISSKTADQCKLFGFGQRNSLRVIPPMMPPGYLELSKTSTSSARNRVALLAAPFDRRKGLQPLPDLVNAGEFDTLLIYGRPRCSHEDLVSFFERLDTDDVEWWLDVDFEKQVELYSRAKVLIFPSKNEGLGFPVLEAYACGTSVLVSDISPLRELVLPEDILAHTDEDRYRQIKTRADQAIVPKEYRSFVESLCGKSGVDCMGDIYNVFSS